MCRAICYRFSGCGCNTPVVARFRCSAQAEFTTACIHYAIQFRRRHGMCRKCVEDILLMGGDDYDYEGGRYSHWSFVPGASRSVGRLLAPGVLSERRWWYLRISTLSPSSKCGDAAACMDESYWWGLDLSICFAETVPSNLYNTRHGSYLRTYRRCNFQIFISSRSLTFFSPNPSSHPLGVQPENWKEDRTLDFSLSQVTCSKPTKYYTTKILNIRRRIINSINTPSFPSLLPKHKYIRLHYKSQSIANFACIRHPTQYELPRIHIVEALPMMGVKSIHWVGKGDSDATRILREENSIKGGETMMRTGVAIQRI